MSWLDSRCCDCQADNLEVLYSCYRSGEVLCPACYALRNEEGTAKYQQGSGKKSTHPLDRWMR